MTSLSSVSAAASPQYSTNIVSPSYLATGCLLSYLVAVKLNLTHCAIRLFYIQRKPCTVTVRKPTQTSFNTKLKYRSKNYIRAKTVSHMFPRKGIIFFTHF